MWYGGAGPHIDKADHHRRISDFFCGLETLEERMLMSLTSPLSPPTAITPLAGPALISAQASGESVILSPLDAGSGSVGWDVRRTTGDSTSPVFPSAPSGLYAVTVSQTQINLTWTSNSGGQEDGFYIDEASDSAFSQNLTTTLVAAGITTYDATGLQADTQYYFRVCAEGTGWGSSHSNSASATTLKNIPAAPSGATATRVSTTQINLAWTSGSDGYEDGFYIDRATDGAFTAGLVTVSVGASVATCNVTGLSAGETYYFRIRAYTNGGSSANCTAMAVIPVAPTALTATAASQTQINLAWSFTGDGEDGFYIDRATDAAFTQGLVTYSVGANTTAFSATGLSNNTTYYFRVRAIVSGGSSVSSATAAATTLKTAPTAPSSLVAIAVTDTETDLAWMPNSGTYQDGFYIDRATNSAFTQNLVTTAVGASAVSYSATGLNADTQYYFRVRAYTNGGLSANCAAASATTRDRIVMVAAGQDLRTAIANAQPGDVLQLSAGTYLVDPSAAGGGPIIVPYDVTIQGVGTGTIIKVKDNVGDFLALFGGWNSGGYPVIFNSFALRNLKVDLNPSGYGGDPSGDYPVGSNPNAMASAIVLGQFNGIAIEGVDFIYGSVNCINLAGYAATAQNAIVIGSTFQFQPVGTGAYDHCGLYFECINQFAIDNVFAGQISTAIAAGSALELHGGPGVAVGNQISDVFVGINLCAAYSVYSVGSPSGDMLVESNTISDVCLGIEFWSDPIVMLSNVTVTNNVINVDNADWSGVWAPGCEWTAGIAMQPNQTGPFEDITVTNNLINFQNETQPVGSFISAGVIFYTHAGLIGSCVAADNTVNNLPASAG
jgi:hypothetical protein